jgi:hypothetical protein
MKSLFTPSISNLSPSYISLSIPPSPYPPSRLVSLIIKTYRISQCTFCGQFNLAGTYVKLVGFGRACAPVRCAHPSYWSYYHAKRGAARPPPALRSFAASYFTPKNILNLSNLGRPRQGPFSFHRNTDAMKYKVHLPPASPSQLC